MAAPIVIVGTGGMGREIAFLAAESGREVAGFLDDDAGKHGSNVGGHPVLGPIEAVPRGVETIVGIGSPRVRRTAVRRLEAVGALFATLVHPGAVVGPRVSIGPGTQVSPGCVMTCDIAIGAHCIINLGCRVSHDCVLEDFCTVAPGVTLPGNTHMECGTEVAIGATMKQGLTLGQGSMLGMGAVLTRDIPPNHLAIGLPARALRELDPWDDGR